ncbi:LCP family protein [Amycolatopsis nigrescens]|uniref:LCP family protein n=1 Tax=Amycolatopsis nigrescens TaxID=381445 RepID=UPI00039A8AF7|nr:LCP family protein [Amycolatopsis nigrescens]
MKLDPTEALIREALTEEADQAVDSDTVRARLYSGGSPSRRYRVPVLAAAAAVVVAVAGAVVVPQLLDRPGDTAAAPAAPAAETGVNVLLLGMDSRQGAEPDDGARADSIVLAHLGQDGTGAVMSIPRDSGVDVPGYGTNKLSTAYQRVRQDALAKGRSPADADEAAARAMTATVSNLTGVPVDHYAIIDMAGFTDLSTAVGGVPVCLKQATRDPVTGVSFPAGRQTVSGSTALEFLRQRHGAGMVRGDFDRIVRLQAFLKSLATTVLTAPEPAREQALTNLLSTARDSVRTDPGWNLLGLAGQLLKLRVDTMRLLTVPVSGSPVGTAGEWMEGLDPAQVRSFVQENLASGPATGTPPTTGSGEPPADVPCVN